MRTRILTALVAAVALVILTIAPAGAAQYGSQVNSNGATMTLTLNVTGTLVTSSVATLQLPRSWANHFCAYVFINRDRPPDLFSVTRQQPDEPDVRYERGCAPAVGDLRRLAAHLQRPRDDVHQRPGVPLRAESPVHSEVLLGHNRTHKSTVFRDRMRPGGRNARAAATR